MNTSRVSKAVWIAVTLVTISFLRPHTAFGCVCPRGTPEPVKIRVGKADAVFVGTVMYHRVETPSDLVNCTTRTGGTTTIEDIANSRMAACIRVEVPIKGPEQFMDIKIQTSYNSAGCGYRFKEGQSYLVFARSVEGGEYVTNFCMQNQNTSEAGSDLADLGKRYPNLRRAFLPKQVRADSQLPTVTSLPERKVLGYGPDDEDCGSSTRERNPITSRRWQVQ